MNTNKLQNSFCRRRKPSRTEAIVFAAALAAALSAAAQTAATSATDFAAFQVISQRNIFNQNRVPHERAAQQARVPDSFSLVGTMFYAGGDIAFFDGTSDAWRKALQVGGDIAGFKITAMTLNSVTLSNGTNETVLNVATQMRRDDNGNWSVSTEPVSYANVGGTSGSSPERTSLGHSRRYRSDSTQSNSAATAGGGTANGEVNSSSPNLEDNPSAAPVSTGGASDALSRLMQRRAQQEQQIGQGQ